ncbi:DcaP family trimeric outer membrane transporter [Pendulispora albinea]|uniref:DcaP family trimeric outer membrane transporter n=1 Tax=Pendulispora albinea TaxID=2741071 RepID=A0ABZ2M808_9BACT
MKLVDRLPLLPLVVAIASVTSMTSVASTASAQDAQPQSKQVAQATGTPGAAPEAPATPETVPPAQTPVTTQVQQPPATSSSSSSASSSAAGAEEEKLPPGTFKIPGTRTTLTLSGYAQLDITYDFRGRDPNVEGNDYAAHAANIPLNDSYESKEKRNQLYLTARTSRIGFSTNTPTDFADIGVKIEADFVAGNLLSGQTFTNSVLFRLRHAYGTLSGKYGTLLVGQSWSTFLDLPSVADTVDFNGPATVPLIRQPQVRYTIPLGGPFTAAIAAENAPGTDYNGTVDAGHSNGGRGSASNRRVQTIPDIIAVVGASGNWGSFSIAGVTMNYRNASREATAATPTNPAVPAADGYNKQGWGARASGALKLPWGDTLRGNVAGGNGIGRYLFNAGLAGQGATATDTSFVLWQALGYHVNYTRVWSPMFRSNVTWAQTYFKNNGQGPYEPSAASPDPGVNQRIDELFINTFITVNKQVEFGLEYIFGERRTFGLEQDAAGQSCGTGVGCQKVGTNHRIGASAHFNFF